LDQINKAFGKVVRELRVLAGMSQEALGQEAGLQRNFISSIELGAKQPSLGSVFKIAAALKISAGDLLALVEANMISK